jgi:hypothetical protein
LYPNGTFFKGNFENNLPKGNGRWTFQNGNSVDGIYLQKKRIDTESTD